MPVPTTQPPPGSPDGPPLGTALEIDLRTRLHHAAVVYGDGHGVLTSASAAVTDLLGHHPEDLVGRAALDLVHPDDRDLAAAAILELRQGSADEQVIEVRLGTADGGWRWVEMLFVALAEGDATRIMALAWSIAERKEATAELEASEARLRRLLDRSQSVVVVSDAERRRVFVSRSVHDVLGWTAEEFALVDGELIHPADRDLVVASSEEVRSRPDGSARVTARIATPAGRWRWIEIVSHNLLDDPRVQGVVSTVHDVTELVEAEREGRLAELRLRGVLQQASDAVVIIDADRAVSFISRSVHQAFGVDPDQIGSVGILSDWVDEDDAAMVQEAFERAYASPREPIEARFRTRQPDGTSRWVEASIVNMLDDPDVAGVVVSSRDVTERMEAEGAVRASERRFRALVQNSSDITLVIDPQATISWVSPAVTRVLGYEPEDLVGTSAADLTHPDDLVAAQERLADLIEGQRGESSVSIRVRHADGQWRHVGIVGSDMSDDPDVGGLILNVRDITTRMLAQQASDRLGTIVETTSDIVGIAEPGGMVYLNASAREFFGLAPDTDPSALHILDRVPNWVRHTWNAEVEPALRDKGLWSGELAAVDATGRVVSLSTVLVAHKGADGTTEVVSGIGRDMSERKAFESQLEHQATHDPLTGLPNRTLLMDRLEVALGRAVRNRRAAGVLFLDLDHFKVVNDSLGHGAGDRLLVLIAERLAATLRPGDTVARFGGDEFVILCEDLNTRDEAIVIAERIAEAVATPTLLDDVDVFITASIGIAMSEGGEALPEDLVRDADAAMYEAKERGRSRAEVFDAHLRIRAIDRLELENSLRRAIERHELRVAYQPKVALDTGRIIGFEALLRWEHPERGALLPADFLGIAEETRLIVPIGRWMALQACRVLAKAQLTIPGGEELAVCINLSARQLASAQLVDDFRDILDETGVDPGTVDVEITESVLMEDVDVSQATLERLKGLGLLIAVDDFGTGYSSLAYLRKFPVDLLKVDRTFVDGLGVDPSDTAIVAAVVNLAHTLGLRAIAEGVETPAQLAELRRMGCDIAQGFYLSRPIPDADLLELLASQPVF